MKDGYYLSTYIHIDGLSNLMDVSVRHDQNISLWRKTGNKIELVKYWELERLTGLKQHKKSFINLEETKNFINTLLEPYCMTMDDMNEIWGTPGIQTCNDYHSLDDYPDFAYHSICHLFSAIMLDTDIFYNNTIIGMAVDAGPDYVISNKGKHYYYSGCIVRNGIIESIFPVYSPGMIWELARNYYGLREGTLMALASASASEMYNLPDPGLIKICDSDSDLSTLYDYVSRLISIADGLSERDAGILFNGFDSRFSDEDNRISMVMKEIQKMSIRIMDYNIDAIIGEYGIDPEQAYIALAGGYILNCPSNSHLMKKYKFKGFIAPPCVSDTGMSLGIALYAFYKKMSKFDFTFKNAFYGEEDTSIEKAASSPEYAAFVKSISKAGYNEMVNDIIEEPIAWFSGAAELGPRALGHRSILADPRSELSKDKLNKIKQRQWWRPVAPVILEEEMEDWFEGAYASPFMLHTFNIKEDKKSSVPAIAHLDGSARIQTINRKTDPLLYELIRSFKEKTGIPILCNTSLNDKGEPIINKIEEAFNFALRKGIKVVYVNGARVELCNHERFPRVKPQQRRTVTGNTSSEEKERLLKKYNPYDLPNNIIGIYFTTPGLHNTLSIDNETDVKAIMKYAKANTRYLLIMCKNLGIAPENVDEWVKSKMEANWNIV